MLRGPRGGNRRMPIETTNATVADPRAEGRMVEGVALNVEVEVLRVELLKDVVRKAEIVVLKVEDAVLTAEVAVRKVEVVVPKAAGRTAEDGARAVAVRKAEGMVPKDAVPKDAVPKAEVGGRTATAITAHTGTDAIPTEAAASAGRGAATGAEAVPPDSTSVRGEGERDAARAVTVAAVADGHPKRAVAGHTAGVLLRRVSRPAGDSRSAGAARPGRDRRLRGSPPAGGFPSGAAALPGRGSLAAAVGEAGVA